MDRLPSIVRTPLVLQREPSATTPGGIDLQMVRSTSVQRIASVSRAPSSVSRAPSSSTVAAPSAAPRQRTLKFEETKEEITPSNSARGDEAVPAHVGRKTSKGQCPVCQGLGDVKITLERHVLGEEVKALPSQRFPCTAQCDAMQQKYAKEAVPEIWRGFINGVRSEAHWAALIKHCQKHNQLLVADFTGPWCGPSRACCPKLTQIAAKFNNVVFVKLQIDPEFSSFPKVREAIGGLDSVPQFVLFESGTHIRDRMTGGQVCDNGELEAAIHRMAASKSSPQPVALSEEARLLFQGRQSMFVTCSEHHVLLRYADGDGPVNYPKLNRQGAPSQIPVKCKTCNVDSKWHIDGLWGKRVPTEAHMMCCADFGFFQFPTEMVSMTVCSGTVMHVETMRCVWSVIGRRWSVQEVGFIASMSWCSCSSCNFCLLSACCLFCRLRSCVKAASPRLMWLQLAPAWREWPACAPSG
jgi:thioredoxin 1